MRLVPRSLAGQFALLLLLALVIAQGIAIALFAAERSEAVHDAHLDNVALRASTVVRLLRDTPPALHSAIIAAASTDEARFTLSREPLVGRTEGGDGADAFARDLSIALGVAPGRVNVAPLQHAQPHEYDHDDGGVHWFAASMSIGGGHWLNVTERPPVVPPWGLTFVLLFMLSALAVAGVAVLMGLWISKPLKSLAAAEDRLGRGEEVDDLPETGPLELQSAARAFNLMHGRLERYVRDRTAMLAAVSHDLRTPITSLRLQAELVEDKSSRTKLLAALAEMQRMTEDTLAFIREDAQREETRTVDLHALIDSVAADLADLGHELAVLDSGRVLVSCRPVALRRAFRNLLENAGAHGIRATAQIAADDGRLCVVIEDDGPGIPDADMERVFEPFVRLDETRSRDTGGAGLGLAIARTIIRGHGGNIRLENRAEGGLRATVSLPGGGGP